MKDSAVLLALVTDATQEDVLPRTGDGHGLRELPLGPFAVVVGFLLETRILRLTKRLWEIGDIVDVSEAWEPARQHNAVATWREALMSVSFINDPKHWRDRAKEARAIADEMKDPDAKQMMLGIARDYILLAERAEARARGSSQSK